VAMAIAGVTDVERVDPGLLVAHEVISTSA